MTTVFNLKQNNRFREMKHNFLRKKLHRLNQGLKHVSAIFYQIFIFHQMVALQKL